MQHCIMHALVVAPCLTVMCVAVNVGCAAAKFQAQQARQAGLDADAAGGVEAAGTGSPRLNAQQRLSSMGGAAAMSAAAPSDVTGICGTGYYISVSMAPLAVWLDLWWCRGVSAGS